MGTYEAAGKAYGLAKAVAVTAVLATGPVAQGLQAQGLDAKAVTPVNLQESGQDLFLTYSSRPGNDPVTRVYQLGEDQIRPARDAQLPIDGLQEVMSDKAINPYVRSTDDGALLVPVDYKDDEEGSRGRAIQDALMGLGRYESQCASMMTLTPDGEPGSFEDALSIESYAVVDDQQDPDYENVRWLTLEVELGGLEKELVGQVPGSELCGGRDPSN